MNKKTIKLILFVFIVFAIAMVLTSAYWQGDSLYKGAYAPLVEKSRERQQATEGDSVPPSEQPDAHGFKERDIERQKGDRFSTY
jgi:hypothetical protein